MPSARDPAPLDLRQHHGVETPEHVEVRLELAGVGSRVAAALLDTILVYLSLMLLILVGSDVGDVGGAGGGWVTAVFILLLFALIWGYFAAFEAWNGGRTPGKQALGIRVAMDTGQPVTAGAAVVRNLVRLLDCYFPFLPVLPALLLMFLNKSNKRLGDMAAGTIVVRDRPTDWMLGAVSPAPPQEEPVETGPPELSEDEFRLLDRFLGRLNELNAAVQVRITTELARRFEGRIPRRTDDAQAYLVQVFAEEQQKRRGRFATRARTGGAGARGERRAQRPVPRPRQAGDAAGALSASRLPRGSGAVVGLRAGVLRPVHRPRGDGLRDDPRAPDTRRRNRVAHNGEPRGAGGAAAGGGTQLRPGRGRAAPGDRRRHHQQQHPGVVRGVRRRAHLWPAHRVAADRQRDDAGPRFRVVQELRRARLLDDVRGGPRGAGADGDLHLGGGGIPARESDHRPGRPDSEGRTGPRRARRRADGGGRRNAARDRGDDRRPALDQRCPRDLEVRRQCDDGRLPSPLPRQRLGLPQDVSCCLRNNRDSPVHGRRMVRALIRERPCRVERPLHASRRPVGDVRGRPRRRRERHVVCRGRALPSPRDGGPCGNVRERGRRKGEVCNLHGRHDGGGCCKRIRRRAGQRGRGGRGCLSAHPRAQRAHSGGGGVAVGLRRVLGRGDRTTTGADRPVDRHTTLWITVRVPTLHGVIHLT